MNTTNHTSPSGEASVAYPRYIVIGYGETDLPQATFVNEADKLLDAVLGMMYMSPSDADAEIREAYRRDLDDPDEWSHGHWHTEFEIGGITIYDLGEPVHQGDSDKPIGEPAANVAIGERPIDEEDAFQDWWKTRKGKNTNAYHGWMARSALTAEKVAAEPTNIPFSAYRLKVAEECCERLMNACTDSGCPDGVNMADWIRKLAASTQSTATQPAQTALTDDVLMQAIADTAARGHVWASRALSNFRAVVRQAAKSPDDA